MARSGAWPCWPGAPNACCAGQASDRQPLSLPSQGNQFHWGDSVKGAVNRWVLECWRCSDHRRGQAGPGAPLPPQRPAPQAWPLPAPQRLQPGVHVHQLLRRHTGSGPLPQKGRPLSPRPRPRPAALALLRARLAARRPHWRAPRRPRARCRCRCPPPGCCAPLAQVLTWGVLLWSAFTLLTPAAAASGSLHILFLVRAIMGCAALREPLPVSPQCCRCCRRRHHVATPDRARSACFLRGRPACARRPAAGSERGSSSPLSSA
jgi:hypothetical protein